MNTDHYGGMLRKGEGMSSDEFNNGDLRRTRIIRWSVIGTIVMLGMLIVASFGSFGACWYDYTVSIRSISQAPIKNVRGMAFHDGSQARKVTANRKVQFEPEAAFDGKLLRVSGIYVCNSWCLDLIHTGAPPRHLVLLVDYEDGKRENKLVELAPGPGNRTIMVEVP